MILLGNYSNWLKQEWIDHIMTTDGMCCPRDKIPENQHEVDELKLRTNAGYDLTQVYWHTYTSEHLPFDIQIPIQAKNYIWWFVKMTPGQFMAMHMDNDPNTTVQRYWMPVTDYQKGHALIYGDRLMTDYKRADLFKFDDPKMLHGSCNISDTVRISFNIDVYD